MRSSPSKEAEVLLWEENTKSQLQFVALAATLVAGVVGASVAWSAADEAHWLVLVLWYGSLVMSLYCVIIAFHLGILFSAFDIRPDRAERILDMLKQRDKDEPRWRSQWVLNMPIALFSWSVISYLVGLALLVVEPLWKVGWEKDGWVCFLSFVFSFLLLLLLLLLPLLPFLFCSFCIWSYLFDFILSFKDWVTDVSTDRHRLPDLLPAVD